MRKIVQLVGGMTVGGQSYRIDDLTEDQPFITVTFHDTVRLSFNQRAAIGQAALDAIGMPDPNDDTK